MPQSQLLLRFIGTAMHIVQGFVLLCLPDTVSNYMLGENTLEIVPTKTTKKENRKVKRSNPKCQTRHLFDPGYNLSLVYVTL